MTLSLPGVTAQEREHTIFDYGAVVRKAISHISNSGVHDEELNLLETVTKYPQGLITGQIIYENGTKPTLFAVIVGGDTYSVPTEQNGAPNIVSIVNNTNKPELDTFMGPISVRVAEHSFVRLLPQKRMPGVILVNDNGIIRQAGHATLALPPTLTSSYYPCENDIYLILTSNSNLFPIDSKTGYKAIRINEGFGHNNSNLESKRKFVANSLARRLIIPDINLYKYLESSNGLQLKIDDLIVSCSIEILSSYVTDARINDGKLYFGALQRAVKHLKEST